MSEFAGQEYDFAAGSIKGLRGWGMDELGRLHGVTHREVWTPGENVAVCKQLREIPCPTTNAPRDRLPKLSEAAVESKPPKRRRRGRTTDPSPYLEPSLTSWEREAVYGRRCGEPSCHNGRHIVDSGHRFDADCQCGFWAYDEAGFKPHGDVIGAIEGYGKVTVGTKGFRAEKARIVAISCENGEGTRHSRSALARLTALYPDAAFANDLSELIDGHPEVLRSWPEVGEDFWLTPVRQRDTVSTASYYRMMQSFGVPSSLLGRGGSI